MFYKTIKFLYNFFHNILKYLLYLFFSSSNSILHYYLIVFFSFIKFDPKIITIMVSNPARRDHKGLNCTWITHVHALRHSCVRMRTRLRKARVHTIRTTAIPWIPSNVSSCPLRPYSLPSFFFSFFPSNFFRSLNVT